MVNKNNETVLYRVIWPSYSVLSREFVILHLIIELEILFSCFVNLETNLDKRSNFMPNSSTLIQQNETNMFTDD